MSGSVSKISRMRAAAVIASCAIARITPSEATGQTSDSISVMKATSSPGVSAPRPTPIAPSSSTTTTARLGITSRKVQNLADSRTLSMLVPWSLRAAASYCRGDVLAAAEGLDHPDADRALLGARGQVALLVLHPARDHDVALLEAHRQPHDRRRGGGDDQAERPVHVEQHDRSPTVTWRMLMTRKSRPKPANRRIAERSVVTRESSWPDCHLVWKLIGSSWSRS